MPKIFTCLNNNYSDVLWPACINSTKQWVSIHNTLLESHREYTPFFKAILSQHSTFYLEYLIYCGQLAKQAGEVEQGQGQANVVNLNMIEKALRMVELLEYVYSPDCFDYPERWHKLIADRNLYINYLTHEGYLMNDYRNDVQQSQFTLGMMIHQVTREGSIFRHFFLRLRQLLINLERALGQKWLFWVPEMESWTKLTVSYAVWLFYVPRWLDELFSILKHTIRHPWMSQQECDLGWFVRFKIQWERHWFLFLHDSGWVISGSIACFLLVGALAPINLYLLCGMQWLDLILVSIRYYTEMTQLQTMQAYYVNSLKEILPVIEKQQTEDALAALEEWIKNERRNHQVHILNQTLLVVAFCLILPIWSFSPPLIIVSAVIPVAVTIISLIQTKYYEAAKKKMSPNLATVGFFKTASHEGAGIKHEEVDTPLFRITAISQ